MSCSGELMKPAIRAYGLVVFLCLLLPATVGAATSAISAPAGPYGVGLHVVAQYDYSRSFKLPVDPITGEATRGERARPMQTLVWYPAHPVAQKLLYADYVRTRVTEQQFDLSAEAKTQLTAKREQALVDHLGAAQAQEAWRAPMLASFDASPVVGRFPVVVYAAGAGGTADENADLCEYLASHGYVVIASTSLGTHEKNIAYALEDAESQVRDIEFLVGYAHTLPQADINHLAVLGWSWGGMNNVSAAARDNRIAAVVSFDGTREPAFTKLIPVQAITAPWLYISRAPDTIPQLNKAEIDTTFSLLNEAKYADVYQLTMYPMRHVDFASRHMRESGASDFGEYSQAEVAQAYDVTARYVLHFLDAYLRKDDQGLAFMRRAPRDNAVPAHMMQADVHQAEGLPPSRTSMAEELARRGFAHAGEVYQAARKRDEKFHLSAHELKAWGYGLLDEGRTLDAIEVLKLWITLYPADWDAADSLAEAYQASGNTVRAVQYYRKSLELNPANTNAVKHLKMLVPGST
jgi:dienelactone hydrolase